MLLAYVDESFTPNWYYMAALLVPDQEAISLTKMLDQVMSSAEAKFAVPRDAELHGHDLFHAKGPWSDLAEQHRARIGVYNDAFKAIADHNVKIVLRGVNVERLKQRYQDARNPHTVVLSHLLERINECAIRNNEVALVIADEVNEPARHRSDLASYKNKGTGGWRSSTLACIVDTLHFAPSSASRVVQAADLIVFMYRRTEHPASDQRAIRANQALWDRTSKRIIHQHCWLP